MEYYFDIGNRFMDDFDETLEWEVVRIDYQDDEYPYECWPVDIIKQAQEMVEDGGYTGEDGEFWECDDVYMALLDCFADERMCQSDYDIKDYMYKQIQKENKQLKAENKKLKSEIKKLKGEN